MSETAQERAEAIVDEWNRTENPAWEDHDFPVVAAFEIAAAIRAALEGSRTGARSEQR